MTMCYNQIMAIIRGLIAEKHGGIFTENLVLIT